MPPTGQIYNSTSVNIKYLILMSVPKLDFIWTLNIDIKVTKYQLLPEFREDWLNLGILKQDTVAAKTDTHATHKHTQKNILKAGWILVKHFIVLIKSNPLFPVFCATVAPSCGRSWGLSSSLECRFGWQYNSNCFGWGKGTFGVWNGGKPKL